MANRKHCGHCGEKIQPHHPQRFDTRHKDVVYHEHCFWGRAIANGWSYLAQPGHRPPSNLHLACHGCTGSILIHEGPVWYEQTEDGYTPYHTICAPSKLLD
jgi:hypothetical protein